MDTLVRSESEHDEANEEGNATGAAQGQTCLRGQLTALGGLRLGDVGPVEVRICSDREEHATAYAQERKRSNTRTPTALTAKDIGKRAKEAVKEAVCK